MKKFLCVLTIALTAALTAAGTVVYAEEAATSYPDFATDLTFTALTSYAVNDGGTQFAFAQGSDIYIFDGSETTGGTYSGTLDSDGSNLYYYQHTDGVTDLAFDGESLVFTDGTAVYQLDGGKAVASGYVFSGSEVVLYNNIYYSISGGKLTFWDGSETAGSLSDGTYAQVKACGGSLYVIKDNVLCRVTGSSKDDVAVQQLTFEYLDLTLGEYILTGNAANVLSAAASGVSLVTLDAWTFVTHVDLDDLGGDYFVVGSQGTFAISEDTTYLYLGTVGNLYVISDGVDAYVTANSGTIKSATVGSYTTGYALLNTAVNLYSVPYMCDSTAIMALDYGAKVTVNGVYTDSVLQCDFACVTFTADDSTEVTGYVAVSFLTGYDFAAESGSYNEAEYVDEYSDENIVLAVILVMVIVVLVIIGIGYIGYSANKSKNDEKDEKENKESK